MPCCFILALMASLAVLTTAAPCVSGVSDDTSDLPTPIRGAIGGGRFGGYGFNKTFPYPSGSSYGAHKPHTLPTGPAAPVDQGGNLTQTGARGTSFLSFSLSMPGNTAVLQASALTTSAIAEPSFSPSTVSTSPSFSSAGLSVKAASRTTSTKKTTSSSRSASSKASSSPSISKSPVTTTVVESASTANEPIISVVTSSSTMNTAMAVANAPASCTVSEYSAVSSAVSACTSLVLDSIDVPAGVTLDLSDLADGSSVIFTGTTTFGYKEWEGPLVEFSGASLTITGTAGSVLDGQGALYWDGKGSNGGKTKPKFFKLSKVTGNSLVQGITIKNSPVQVFSVSGCSDLTLESITVDNSAGDTGGGHNTDAFDVGTSTSIKISNAHVENQDDCLAINSGSDITFTGGYCSSGHGLSIGSVGGRSDNDVSNVLITNSEIVNSANGVRIKTVSGATGSVSNVSYSNVKMSGITDYGIVIEQDYENGSPTGTPTSGVPITNLNIDGITGTVNSDAQDVYILCASCSDWTWKGVSVTGGSEQDKCEGVPSGASC